MAGTQLTPELVDELLDKLGSDDDFRADFQKNPDAAMGLLGGPANFKCVDCWLTAPLVSKDEILKTRALLKKRLLDLDLELLGMDDPWLLKPSP